jgi:MYXO-CTERM domain-containing protein
LRVALPPRRCARERPPGAALDEEADEDVDVKPSKKKRENRVVAQSSGCSVGSDADPFSWLPALGIVVAFGAVRRRRE